MYEAVLYRRRNSLLHPLGYLVTKLTLRAVRE